MQLQVPVQRQEDVTHLAAPAQARWSPAPSRIAIGRREPPPLTRREREVLALLQGRLTDREIADSLCIGVRTAECHVARACQARRGQPARSGGGGCLVRPGVTVLFMPWQTLMMVRRR